MSLKKILIADDEQDILDILEKKFIQKNYKVLALSEGREVLLAADKFKPDLFILDIIMPYMDGYTIGLRLRASKSFKNTPIIFVTGKELEVSGIEKREQELGFCDFIAKPCNFEDLLMKVEKIIG